MNDLPDHKVYEIRTLQDIFNLPTAGAMERCLRELTEMMVSTRAYCEMMVAVAEDLAKEDGKTIPEDALKRMWPEVARWTDDGGLVGSKVSLVAPDGQNLGGFSIEKKEDVK